jgi:AraC-like DNA-binding protein
MRPLTPSPSHHPAAQTLESIRFKTAIFCHSELRAPWGFSVDARDFASFHLVTGGRAFLDTEGQPEINVETGDLVILPRGHAHTVRDAPGSPSTRLERLIANGTYDHRGMLTAGGTGPVTTLLCGGFHADRLELMRVTAALPAVIHLRPGEYREDAWTRMSLRLLVDEAQAPRPGADVLICRLAEMLFIDALRSYLVSSANATSAFTIGLRDARIAEVIRHVEERPDRSWDLERLARSAAMSRTTFACRFRDVVGISPGAFVTRARMTKAAELLGASHLTIPAIAAHCGYGSDATFSRAFKRWYGKSPAQYRRDEN